MNKYNVEALSEFRSKENINILIKKIRNHFGSALINNFVDKNIYSWIGNFLSRLDKEWLYTSMVITPDINNMVSCLNMMFLDHYYDEIELNFPETNRVDNYQISDRHPASSSTILSTDGGWRYFNMIYASHGQRCRSITDKNLRTLIDYNREEAEMLSNHQYNLTARNGMFRQGNKINEWGRLKYTDNDYSTLVDRKLEVMRYNYHPIQLLDDAKLSSKDTCMLSDKEKLWMQKDNRSLVFSDKKSQCDVYPYKLPQTPFELNKGGDNVPIITVGDDFSYGPGADGDYGQKSSYLTEDVTREGYGQHEKFLLSPLNNTLNENKKLWANSSGFSDIDDPLAEERLARRNIFRSYPQGNCPQISPNKYKCIPNGDHASNQIPFYERSLTRRYHDRSDGDDTRGGNEFGSIQRGYDMSSLLCRVNKRVPEMTKSTGFSFKFD